VLALLLFPLGYARVWRKLTDGLVGLEVPSPSEKALRDLRRRLGPAPFKALFEVVAGPLGRSHTPGVCYRGMRTVAFDGCCCGWPCSPSGTAVESQPGTNPDRASFTTALQAARDQIVTAAGILPADRPDRPDLLGVIGRAVLSTLLPPRRARWSARRVKNATSRYLNRDDRRPALPTTITAIDIALHTPAVDASRRPRSRRRNNPHAAPLHPTRRDRVTTLMQGDPRRPWSGRELADHLGIKPRNMLTQLAEWTRLGFLTRTGAGSYALPTRRDTDSP
jgi:hypothetical protein